jgi:hypothetical protein
LKKFIALFAGLIGTLYAVNAWAGTFAPKIERHERLVMDDTFYEQTSQIDQTIDSVANEQNKTKVLCIGDSTMYGAIVYANETIPYFLRNNLRPATPNLDLLNLAYPGARPADEYAMLKLAKRANPDLVVIDVNPVFFSPRLLQEGALANKTQKREFLFEPDVPAGVFEDNRVEEIIGTAVQQTNIGQYKPQINKALFGQAPRQYVTDAAKPLLPPAPPKPPAAPGQDIIGKSWHAKKWDATEQKSMARIYRQGLLTEDNDSVRMLQRMVQYTKANHINTLFYITPQNETLIGQFFSLDTLHRNEDFLAGVLKQEGAWSVDLRNDVPETYFGDYDHLLKAGNAQVADRLASVISEQGGVRR